MYERSESTMRKWSTHLSAMEASIQACQHHEGGIGVYFTLDMAVDMAVEPRYPIRTAEDRVCRQFRGE